MQTAESATTHGEKFLATWKMMSSYDQARPSTWPPYQHAIPDMIAMKRALDEKLTPAGGHAIRRVHDMLADNFGSARDPDSVRNRITLWAKKLKDWPQFALDAAFEKASEEDTAYMLSIGQFLALGKPALREAEETRADIMRILDTAERGDPFEDFEPDPEVVRKFHRLFKALKNGEDVARLRAEGIL